MLSIIHTVDKYLAQGKRASRKSLNKAANKVELHISQKPDIKVK